MLPEQLVMTAGALCSTLSSSPCNPQHRGSVKPVTHPESQTRPDNLPDKLPVLSTTNSADPDATPPSACKIEPTGQLPKGRHMEIADALCSNLYDFASCPETLRIKR